MTAPDLPRALAEADSLVGQDPLRAQRTALETLAAARVAGDTRTVAAAYRAHGRAAYELGRLDEAMASLRQAIRHATRADDAITAARARMTLAFILTEQGRTATALRELDRAAPALRGVHAGELLMQRGLVLWRVGRTEEALGELPEGPARRTPGQGPARRGPPLQQPQPGAAGPGRAGRRAGGPRPDRRPAAKRRPGRARRRRAAEPRPARVAAR